MAPKKDKRLAFEEYEVIQVEWTDAWFDFDARSGSLFIDEYVVNTVGFYISHTDKVLHLAMELLPDGDLRAITHLPWTVVRAINGKQVSK